MEVSHTTNWHQSCTQSEITRRGLETTMTLEKRVVGDITILKIVGEMTLNQSGDNTLDSDIQRLMADGNLKVLVDLAGVSYVDSAGLGQLVQAHYAAKTHGGGLKVFSPTSRLRDLLQLTRLTTVFGLYDDEAQAIASFTAGR